MSDKIACRISIFTSKKLVDTEGVEPYLSQCKSDAFPIMLPARSVFMEPDTGFEPAMGLLLRFTIPFLSTTLAIRQNIYLAAIKIPNKLTSWYKFSKNLVSVIMNP